MSNSKTKISAPKGRPMLNWVGKQPLDYIKSFPAQLVETFNPLVSPRTEPVLLAGGEGQGVRALSFKSLEHNWQNLLFHGDNKEILGTLLNNGFRGKIDLIYIDPPFDSGADYIRKIELRGVKNKTKIEGDDYNYLEQTQYFDIWNQDGYLQFMYERLILLRELLSVSGCIYVHCDWHRSHQIRFLLDEVFGAECFLNEIVWRYVKFQMGKMKKFANNSDRIMIYTKSAEKWLFNPLKYKLDSPKRLLLKGWDKESGTIQNIKDENGKTQKMVITDEKVDDVWDLQFMGATSGERTQYPTQKPERVLERVLSASSNPNMIVLDCFIGSGTTAAVAQKLGRRWIGCDINKGAIQTTSKRLQKIIIEQIEEEKKKHPELFTEKSPSQGEGQRVRSFAHYKVNDYDLQLLRTEAIELAVQHLGIQRSKTEAFFDGTLGKTLVKLIDFNHPLTLLDLQQIQDELKKRPKEQRDITVVCLGRELTTEPWVEEYNKKHPVNKLQIIELRTDSKYGKFLIHQPAIADVEITRFSKEKKCKVEIKDFISPTILERLNLDENLFKVKIPDFRSMIDVVLIDNNYDGSLFNITYSDVPEKKNDLINGTYEIDLLNKDSKIAVKIIDMLGEEVLIVK